MPTGHVQEATRGSLVSGGTPPGSTSHGAGSRTLWAAPVTSRKVSTHGWLGKVGLGQRFPVLGQTLEGAGGYKLKKRQSITNPCKHKLTIGRQQMLVQTEDINYKA